MYILFFPRTYFSSFCFPFYFLRMTPSPNNQDYRFSITHRGLLSRSWSHLLILKCVKSFSISFLYFFPILRNFLVRHGFIMHSPVFFNFRDPQNTPLSFTTSFFHLYLENFQNYFTAELGHLPNCLIYTHDLVVLIHFLYLAKFSIIYHGFVGCYNSSL
jgi:hypothetical protein